MTFGTQNPVLLGHFLGVKFALTILRDPEISLPRKTRERSGNLLLARKFEMKNTIVTPLISFEKILIRIFSAVINHYSLA